MGSYQEIIGTILEHLRSIDGSVLALLVTILAGFIAWLYKEVTYRPIHDSRETFYRHTEKRIEILSEIRNILIVMGSATDDEILKQKLRETLESGDAGYLSENMSYDLIEIAYGEATSESFWRLMREINNELSVLIGQIERENNFYLEQSRLSILGKITQFVVSTFQITLICTVVLILLICFVVLFISFDWWRRIAMIFFTILLLFIMNSGWFRNEYEKLLYRLKRKIKNQLDNLP